MNHIAAMNFPDTAIVKQKLFASPIKDVPDAVLTSLSPLPVFDASKIGKTVAVAVGSRGISHIDHIVYHCLKFLKDNGLKPFIVPAMGSHGGATPEGQQEVLAKLGITPSTMGVPIHAEMAVVQLEKLENGLNIYFSKKALEADYIVVVNRVKPHTKFRADIESGLCKMLTIGLGKAEGATEFHQRAIKHSFAIIEEAADVIMQRLNILFGIALLEDGYGNLSRVEAILPSSIIEREKQLLQESSSMMGKIPFDDIDILIIDYIGKDISGIGMDSNVTGRHRDIVGDFSLSPHVKRIFVRDLSPASDGNANGIGLADVTTKRLVDAMDRQKTYVNSLAAISPEKAAIPVYFDTDRQSMEACAKTIGISPMEEVRIVRIKDTSSLQLLQVSRALKSVILSNPYVEQITAWEPFQFDENGNLRQLYHE